MSRPAHPPIGIARFLGLALAAGASAQAIPVPAPGDLGSFALQALESKDSLARGEAALWLAQGGHADAYREILAVARDPDPRARLRGILAVSVLAPAGAETFLAQVLEQAEPASSDAVVAAYGLGRLPAAVPTPSVDAWLGRAQGSSYRRLREPLAALLAGLSQRPHPESATALGNLRRDAANREAILLVLAARALEAAGVPADLDAARADLSHREPLVRRAALRTLLRGDGADVDPDVLRRMARADADAGVRAAALELLARHLDDQALALAERALAGRDAEEASTAAKVMLHLAGDAAHAPIEAKIASSAAPAAVRAALLDLWDQPLSPRLVFACRDAARAATAPAELRVAAACALRRHGARDASGIIAELLPHVTEAAQVERLLSGADPEVRVGLRRALSAPGAVDAPHFAVHLEGLARVDAELAGVVAAAQLGGRDAGRAAGVVLAALRRARAEPLPSGLRDVLPPVLGALLP